MITIKDIQNEMGGSDHKCENKIKESLKFLPPHILITMSVKDIADFVIATQKALHEKWLRGYKEK